MHWEPIHFHRDQAMTLALMGKYFWNSMIFLHFDKVNLKKKGEPKDHDHPRQSYILFGVLSLWCLVKCIVLYFLSLSQKCFPSMQVLPGLVSVSILMDTPGTLGKKLGSSFHFFKPRKERAFKFRIDVCNMCLPWAITNWVSGFYSFKNALGAHSLSQRPRHGLGTDGKIFLKFYEFFSHFDKVNLKKRAGTRRQWSPNTIWLKKPKKLLEMFVDHHQYHQ